MKTKKKENHDRIKFSEAFIYWKSNQRLTKHTTKNKNKCQYRLVKWFYEKRSKGPTFIDRKVASTKDTNDPFEFMIIIDRSSGIGQIEGFWNEENVS